ncbi:MAG: hypothetical protein LBU43_02055 [Candidatus Accumulibacter sp.]|nr:hypothetical protein [Accumulibacter sp.]
MFENISPVFRRTAIILETVADRLFLRWWKIFLRFAPFRHVSGTVARCSGGTAAVLSFWGRRVDARFIAHDSGETRINTTLESRAPQPVYSCLFVVPLVPKRFVCLPPHFPAYVNIARHAQCRAVVPALQMTDKRMAVGKARVKVWREEYRSGRLLACSAIGQIIALLHALSGILRAEHGIWEKTDAEAPWNEPSVCFIDEKQDDFIGGIPAGSGRDAGRNLGCARTHSRHASRSGAWD